jgi:hypothetical protein
MPAADLIADARLRLAEAGTKVQPPIVSGETHVIGRIGLLAVTILLGGCNTLGAGFNSKPFVPTDEENKLMGLKGSPQREYLYRLLADSDAQCEDYLIGASVTRNGLAVLFDTLSAGLTAVGTVIRPETTTQALAAGATFTQNTRKSLNDELLGGQAYGLIYRSVHDGRAEIRQRIYTEAENKVFDQWSAVSIAAYVNGNYHNRCGVNFALGRLSEAEGRARTADQATHIVRLEEQLRAAGKTPVPRLDASGMGNSATVQPQQAPIPAPIAPVAPVPAPPAPVPAPQPPG